MKNNIWAWKEPNKQGEGKGRIEGKTVVLRKEVTERLLKFSALLYQWQSGITTDKNEMMNWLAQRMYIVLLLFLCSAYTVPLTKNS